jgi:hypothetical protein
MDFNYEMTKKRGEQLLLHTQTLSSLGWDYDLGM